MTPLRLLSDESLARLAAGGNSNAFALIYERHGEALQRYCRSILRNPDQASDALQATMAKALAALRNGSAKQRPRMLRAWLYRIAHNESVSLLRERRPTAILDEELIRAATPSPEVRARLRDLLEDLGQLSDRRRAALLMRELCGLSYDEIGAALGCSVSAARQSTFEARTALSDLAEGRDSSCEAIRHKISDGDRRVLRARRVRAHLSHCAPCRSFDAALSGRRNGLGSLFPLLPVGGAGAFLNAAIAGAGGSGAGGLAASGGAVAGGSALAGLGVKSAIAGVATLAAAGAVAVETKYKGGETAAPPAQVRAAGAVGAGDAPPLSVGDAAREVAAKPTPVASATAATASYASTDVQQSVEIAAASSGQQANVLAPVGGGQPIPGGSDPVIVSVHPDASAPQDTGVEEPVDGVGDGDWTGSTTTTPTTPTSATTSSTSSNPVQQMLQGAQQLVQQATASATQWQQTASSLLQQSQQWSQQWSGSWDGGSWGGD